MTFSRPSRSDQHLSNYWNALVRNAPAEELARLARLVEPSEIAAIERARAAHTRYEPDPFFARRLEQALMNTAISPLADTISQPHVSPPSRNGIRDPGSVSHRGASIPRSRRGWAHSPAFGIALTILLILSSVTGVWWINTRPDERYVIMAPIETPGSESSLGWTHFKGDAARTGETNFGPVSQPVELWRYQANGPCYPPPVVAADTVYAACDDGNLYAFDTATGNLRWTFTAEPFGDGTTVVDGLVYAIGGEGVLYAVDAITGVVQWRFDAYPITTTPAIDGGLAVAGTPDGFLLGIDAATGEERWRTQISDQGAARVPALLDGVVYAGSEEGNFTAIDTATGEIAWQVDTGDLPTGTAVVADGIAYIGAAADDQIGSLAAYDAETGDLLWRRDEPIYSPSVSNGIGYSGSADGTVYAYDTASGEEIWRTQLGGIARPNAVAGDIVYVPVDGERAIVALDTATGEELWRVSVDGGIDSQASMVDGVIYVATTFGVIQAFAEAPGSATPPTALGSLEATRATPVGEATTPIVDIGTDVTFLWQSTGGPDPLYAPLSMTFDPEGNLWVTDAANSRFQIISPEGEYLETWGAAGDGEGEFNFVHNASDPGGSWADIAFAPDGSFYVADAANRRVQQFDANRQFVRTWGSFGRSEGQFGHPIGIAVAPDGNVYVSDDLRGDIQVFSPDGDYLFTFGSSGSDTGQFTGQGSLAIDAAGNVYVADFGNHRLQKFAADGTYLAAIGEFGAGDGQFNGPADVAVDQSGYLYVSDTDGGRVQVFTQDGEFMLAWSAADDGQGAFAVPIGIAVDTAGHVYVADVVAGTVQKFAITLLGAAAETTPAT